LIGVCPTVADPYRVNVLRRLNAQHVAAEV